MLGSPWPGSTRTPIPCRQQFSWRTEGCGRLPNHGEVIAAIHDLHEVQVKFISKDDGGAQLTRRCAPMDYGPARSMKVPEDRYHFWDFECDSGANHVLPLPDAQLVSVEVLSSTFDPSSFVTWNTNWHISRSSWGAFN